MARRATSLERLSALAVKSHSHGGLNTKPLHDGGGLYLRKFSENWYWYLRGTSPVTGRPTWIAIRPGVPYPATTLEHARNDARGMRSNVANGIEADADRKAAIKLARDIKAAEQVAQLRNITLREAFDRWRSVDLQPQLRADGKRAGRKDGGAYVSEQFERHVFPRLGELPLQTVTKRDVLEILDSLKAQGKLRTANVVLADLKQLFRFAADRELIEVSAIERLMKTAVGGSDVERERHLTFDEIALLAAQLPAANLSRRSELAVWAILATGCRVGELMGATVPLGVKQSLTVRL